MTKAETILGPGIVSVPGVRSGSPVIAGTGTPVRAVVEYWNLGVPIEEIPLRLPHLTLKNVLEALAYYLDHKEEIEQSIAKNHIPPEWRGKKLDQNTGAVVPL